MVVDAGEAPSIQGAGECDIPQMWLEVDSEFIGTLDGAPTVEGLVNSVTATEELEDPWTGEFFQPGVLEGSFSGGYSFGGWGPSSADITYEAAFYLER